MISASLRVTCLSPGIKTEAIEIWWQHFRQAASEPIFHGCSPTNNWKGPAFLLKTKPPLGQIEQYWKRIVEFVWFEVGLTYLCPFCRSQSTNALKCVKAQWYWGKKDLHDPENHDGVVTHLEPHILECEVKWALESITMNKASGGDGIPAELLHILKDDAV